MTDAVLAVLASKWRYHMIVVLMMCMQMLLLAFNTTVMVFYHDVQPHHCKIPEGQTVNETLPPNEDKSSDQPYSSCTMYVDPSNHSAGVEKCLEYEYKTNGDEWTVVSEWNLVCDLSYLPSLISTLYFCGMLVGALVFGDLADRFGRRPILIIGMYLQTSLGVAIYFIQSVTAYIILRTLLGAVTDGIYATSITLLMEYSPIHLRSHMGALFSMFWGIGSLIIGVIAHFFHDWRHIQLAITIPFIFSCIYLLTIPESLRWLLSKGKVETAKETVRTYAKRNGVKLHSTIDAEIEALAKDIQAAANENTSYTYLDLLRTPEMRKRSSVLCTIVLFMALVYYGILFNLTALSGDKYENFLISASLEVAAYMITISIVSLFNRKPLYMTTVFIGVAHCITGMFLKRFSTHDTLNLVSSILILISKSAIVGSFAVINVFIPELFPTVVRNMGFSFVLFFGRIGSLLAPQMTTLGKYTDKLVPFILFAVLYFVSGIISIMLKETRNKPMPETIEEVEESREKQSSFKMKQGFEDKNRSCSTISTDAGL